MTAKTYGKFDVPVGEKCGNLTDTYTCPGCYHDVDEDATECQNCSAPIRCYTEEVTNYYCQIRDPDEDDKSED